MTAVKLYEIFNFFSWFRQCTGDHERQTFKWTFSLLFCHKIGITYSQPMPYECFEGLDILFVIEERRYRRSDFFSNLFYGCNVSGFYMIKVFEFFEVLCEQF